MIGKMKSILRKNPHYFGIFFILLGIVFLISAILDANWLFEDDVSGVTYNPNKIDGWINFFGREISRWLVGVLAVVLMLSGVTWFWVYKVMKKEKPKVRSMGTYKPLSNDLNKKR